MQSITYNLLSKIFEFTWVAVVFFLKKEKYIIFIEKREKQNKSWKNKLKIEKNLRNDQKKVKASLETLQTHSAPTELNFDSYGVFCFDIHGVSREIENVTILLFVKSLNKKKDFFLS